MIYKLHIVEASFETETPAVKSILSNTHTNFHIPKIM